MATHQTAKTRYIAGSNGTKFAYRRLGTGSGVPLLFLIHFRGVIDKWDPLLINTIAAQRSIILVDYVGVGLSIGEPATTARQSANHILEFLQLIGETEVDILGFSLGGVVTQLVALNADPKILKVRKLVLAGTGTTSGPDVARTTNDDVSKWAGGPQILLENFQTLFFPKTRAGILASEAWWDRIHERNESTSGEKPADWLSLGYADGGKGVKAQNNQTISIGTPELSKDMDGAYDRLPQLSIPILVANGKDDYMIPTINSYIIYQRVPNGTLLLYPDSGHGFLFQYAQEFAKYVLDFLAT